MELGYSDYTNKHVYGGSEAPRECIPIVSFMHPWNHVISYTVSLKSTTGRSVCNLEMSGLEISPTQLLILVVDVNVNLNHQLL